MDIYEIKCSLWQYLVNITDGVVAQCSIKGHWSIGKSLAFITEYYKLNKFETSINKL